MYIYILSIMSVIKEINTKRKDLVTAPKHFAMFFPFINDLTAINDGVEFEKALNEIYPPELYLKKQYTSPFELLFLDLNIKDD